MRAYREMTRALALSALREPVSLFFTVFLAPLMVLILGVIFGNDPRPEFGGQGFIGMQMPALTCVVVAMMGVLTVPLDVVGLREQGVLRRLRATPLRPGVIIAADLTRHFAMGVVGMGLALAVGAAAFGVGAGAHVASVALVLVLGLLAFTALGYLLAAIMPSMGVVTPVGNILIIVLLMSSGATVPLAVLPAGVRAAADWSPLTQLVTALTGVWSGDGLAAHGAALAVMVAMTAVCGGLAVRFLRWE